MDKRLVIEMEIDDPCLAAWLMEIAKAYDIPIGKAATQILRMIFEDDMETEGAAQALTMQ